MFGGIFPDGADRRDESDIFMGGAGFDTVSYAFKDARVVVTLDGNANDGSRNERDNVDGDVEMVIGSNQTDRLVGNDRRNTLDGGPGNDRLFGERGNNDRLFGGPANDLLVGGRGRDQMFGQGDNDCVQARDGLRDRAINGGDGQDEIANYDPAEQARLRLFETQSPRGRCPR